MLSEVVEPMAAVGVAAPDDQLDACGLLQIAGEHVSILPVPCITAQTQDELFSSNGYRDETRDEMQ